MTLLYFVFAAFVLLGHVSVFIYAVNRLHAMAWPRPLIKTIDLAWSALAAIAPFVLGVWILRASVGETSVVPAGPWSSIAAAYFTVCSLAALLALFNRIRYVMDQAPVSQLVSNHTSIVNIARQLQRRPAGDKLTSLLSYLPGNEIFELSIHRKNLGIAGLPDQLDGLTITHLSDLHMTGQLDRTFYEELVRQSNSLDSDLVVVTGDIVEKKRCLDWIGPTLGQLTSRYGVFYVVGNHELRVRNIELVRKTLNGAGLIGVGSSWQRLEIKGHPVVIAGNELPWFKPAADMNNCPVNYGGRRALRILLSHSPDQLEWAQQRNFDLMLAGHTHGGQVRLPWLGPLLAPSRKGIKHSAGTFYARPTLLHVSRGVAGTRAVRLNCRPELAQLTLRVRQAEPERPTSG